MANFFTITTLGCLLGVASLAQAQNPTFASFATYKTVASNSSFNYPTGIAVADINGDNKLDVVTANSLDDAVGVLLGNGDGTFQAVQAYFTGTTFYATGPSYQPVRVAIADMNGDSKPDVVVENNITSSVGILLGNGDGTFQTVTAYGVGGSRVNATGLVVADVNADGKPDVLTANYSINAMSVLLASSTGAGLAPAMSYSTGEASNPRSITVADVNNDGKPDALTANSKSGTVGILLGNGDGTFKTVATYPTNSGVGNTVGIATGDLDSDGKRDVLLLNNLAGTVDVLMGNGNGTLQTVKSYDTGLYSVLANPVALAVADINGDGRLDALTANYTDNTVGVLQGLGTGAFKPGLSFNVGTLAQPIGIAVADVNRDGKPDLLTVNNNTSSVSVLLNTTLYTPLATRGNLTGAVVNLAPNPATDHTSLILGSLPAAVSQVQAILFDATGRIAWQQTLASSQGSAHVQLSTNGLAMGLYLLYLSAKDAKGQPVGSLPTQRLSVR